MSPALEAKKEEKHVHVDLSKQFSDWEIKTAPGCVLALGLDFKAGEDHYNHALSCYEPSSGELRWMQKITTEARYYDSNMTVYQDTIVFSDTATIQAFDSHSGKPLWSFDPGGRVITKVVRQGELLLFSLNDNALVAMEIREGRWVRGVKAPEFRLLAGASVEGAPVFVVDLVTKGKGGTLAVIPVFGEGGESAAPPFARFAPMWTAPLERKLPHVMSQGGVLLSWYVTNRLEAFSSSTGKRLYASEPAHLSSFIAKPLSSPSTHSVRAEQPEKSPSEVLEEALKRSPVQDIVFGALRLPEGHLLLSLGGHVLLTMRERKGLVLPIVEVSMLDEVTLKPRWTWSASFERKPVKTLLVDEARKLVVMWRGDAHLVDLETGEGLSFQLPKGRTGWTGVASEGQGLYVMYGRDPQPRLEFWPESWSQ